MLVQLTPEQVTPVWPELKLAIEASLPPIAGMQLHRTRNILTSIMTNDMLAWVGVRVEGNKNIIEGVVLTTTTFDAPSGTKSLLLYCVHGYSNASSNCWKSGFNTLRKYAKGINCNRIIGYTEVDSLKKLAVKYGADAKYTLISFDLEGRDEDIL